MSFNLSTAFSTALPGASDLSEANGIESPQAIEPIARTPKPAKPIRRIRGVWLEHGKWAASAGKNPITGERVREYKFESQDEANNWRLTTKADLMALKVGRRKKGRDLVDAEKSEAAEAFEILKKAGMDKSGNLRLAAEEFVKKHHSIYATPIAEVYEVWLGSKRERERRYETLRGAKSTFAPFLKKYGNRAISSIIFKEVHAFVFDPAYPNANTRIGKGTIIKDFFCFAQRRGFIGPEAGDNPCSPLELPPRPYTEPDPWSPAEFKTLLAFAIATEDTYHATAYIALGGLRGVRTEELQRLRFCATEVNITQGRIRVLPDKAKKRRARDIEMGPELKRLLTFLRGRPRGNVNHGRMKLRPTDEASAVFSKKLLVEFKIALRTPISAGGAGMSIVDPGGKRRVSKNGKVTYTKPTAWRENGLRSAFGTYHFEATGNAELTAKLMGHTGGTDVFYDHYRALARPGEGAAYFAAVGEVLDALEAGR